jgi:hypothetical protein
MWLILNAENQILKYIQIFAAEKSHADLRNPCFHKKSGGFKKSLLLQKIRWIDRILVLTKIRRIYRILALTKNEADLQNPWVYRKLGEFTESLRALKSPHLVKKPAGLEKLAARLLFRLGRISSC